MKLYTSRARKVVGMLREEITLEEFKKDYQKTMVTFPVPDPEQSPVILSLKELKKLKRNHVLGTIMFRSGVGIGILGFFFLFLSFPLGMANGTFIGQDIGGEGGSIIGSLIGAVVGIGVAPLPFLIAMKLTDKGEELMERHKPKELSAVANSEADATEKTSELKVTAQVESPVEPASQLLVSSDAGKLLAHLQGLILTVSSSPHGTETGYEVKRITDDMNSLLSISGELSKYDSAAADERLMKGLRLLERDAAALVDHEKTLITQRLDSHNSYMETRSMEGSSYAIK